MILKLCFEHFGVDGINFVFVLGGVRSVAAETNSTKEASDPQRGKDPRLQHWSKLDLVSWLIRGPKEAGEDQGRGFLQRLQKITRATRIETTKIPMSLERAAPNFFYGPGGSPARGPKMFKMCV